MTPVVIWCVYGERASGLAMLNAEPWASGKVRPPAAGSGKKLFGMRAPERESLAIWVVMNPGYPPTMPRIVVVLIWS